MRSRNLTSTIKFLTFAVLLVVTALGAAPSDQADPLPPQQLPATGNCYYDNVFYGAIPPGGEASRVLVFVHGLSGLAEDWWSDNTPAGLNDMYLQAYHAGYRTAFVNLNITPDTPADCSVKRRPADDVMRNGFVLKQQLDAITQYYGVSQVDLVGHSKGGIDAQAAIVWWGAWRQVRNVFTLSTPHQGSLLADLFWSPEGFWVSILLGQRDPATYSIRTASMQLFRAATDPSPVDDAIHYYSGAGNFWQTPDTLYALTGQWLQNNPEGGDNDGVVDVAHTYLPGATTLFVQPWNHAEVYMGWNSFPYIHQVLLNPEPVDLKIYLPLIQVAAPISSSLEARGASQAAVAQEATGVFNSLESNLILRGGRLNGPITILVPIEPQVRAANFMLLATDKAITANLLGPDSLTHPLQAVPNDNQEVFASAFSLGYTVRQPSPGYWAIQTKGPPGAGYLLIVTLDSPLRVSLDGLPNHPVPPGTAVQLTARSLASTSSAQVDQIKMRASRSAPQTNSRYLEDATTRTGSALSRTFTEEGLYGISITVTGETAGGRPFERSFVGSLAVVPAQKLVDTSAILDMLSRR